MNLDFRIGHQRLRSFDDREPRTMRHHTWVAVAVGGSAVLGAGTALYGANKQSKAMKDAAVQNQESMDKQNASAWASYLMSRGVNPSGAVTGQIPTNSQAVNTRLPLWATVKRTSGGGLVSSAPSAASGSSSLGGRTWAGLGINK